MKCPTLLLLSTLSVSTAFISHHSIQECRLQAAKSGEDNKAMAFLRKIGKVGGGTDFTYALGLDEGPGGKSKGSKPLRKETHAFQSAEQGVIDDLTEPFPSTSTGTQWSGYTDQVMGGVSTGSVSREEFDGKTANVIRGHVRLENNGGFVQMAANLAPDRSIDASEYDGIEIDVQYSGDKDIEKFNIHLKNTACPVPFSSYRSSFEAENGEWRTVRLPWNTFKGHGPGASETKFSPAKLIRAGIVAIGSKMDFTLAVAGVRFYKE